MAGAGPITPNQVVAFNLREARTLRGWTQERAAEELAPHLGVKWSKASYSQAERSFFDRRRIRHFTADELDAFSKAFDLPVIWFFVPPVSGPDGGPAPQMKVDLAPGEGDSAGAVLNRLLGDEGLRILHERLFRVFRELPDSELLPDQKAVGRLATEQFLALLDRELGDVSRWADQLRELVRILDVLQVATPSQIVERRLLETIEEAERLRERQETTK